MKSYTSEEREGHLENWRRGTLSRNAYAKAAGISPRTFAGWAWRMAETAGKQGFVEIDKRKVAANGQELILEKYGITIRVPLHTGIKELETIFTAIGGRYNDN